MATVRECSKVKEGLVKESLLKICLFLAKREESSVKYGVNSLCKECLPPVVWSYTEREFKGE